MSGSNIKSHSKNGKYTKNEGKSNKYAGKSGKYAQDKNSKNGNFQDKNCAYVKPPISELYVCQSCGKGLIRRPSKFKGFWWSCSNYPTCKQTYHDKNGKPDFSTGKK